MIKLKRKDSTKFLKHYVGLRNDCIIGYMTRIVWFFLIVDPIEKLSILKLKPKSKNTLKKI